MKETQIITRYTAVWGHHIVGVICFIFGLLFWTMDQTVLFVAFIGVWLFSEYMAIMRKKSMERIIEEVEDRT